MPLLSRRTSESYRSLQSNYNNAPIVTIKQTIPDHYGDIEYLSSAKEESKINSERVPLKVELKMSTATVKPFEDHTAGTSKSNLMTKDIKEKNFQPRRKLKHKKSTKP